MRRGHGTWTGGLLGLGLLGLTAAATAQETLTFTTWGGVYTRSQMLAYVRPFEAATGIDVEVLDDYNGGLEAIRGQVRALNVKWDVVDLEAADVLRGCRENLLQPIDPQVLAPSPTGRPAEEDFIEGGLEECGVGTVVWATVVAYDEEAVDAPQGLEDFFDIKRFPGRRGLRRTPKANLEWALLADGVSPERVYPLLETEDGLRRAFSVLNRIKPQIVWWRSGEEAVRLLETGRVAMTSAYSGRIHDAVQERGRPFGTLWDRQVWNVNYLAIPRGTEKATTALRFIRFATGTGPLAEQSRHIPYGPVRRSSLERVPETVRPHLPTAQQNRERAFRLDHHWWAEHYGRIERRFEQWLQRPVQVPRALPH